MKKLTLLMASGILLLATACSNSDEPGINQIEEARPEIQKCDSLTCNRSEHNNLPGDDYDYDEGWNQIKLYAYNYGYDTPIRIRPLWKLTTDDVVMQTDRTYSIFNEIERVATVPPEVTKISFKILDNATLNPISKWRFSAIGTYILHITQSGDSYIQDKDIYCLYHSYENLPEWAKFTKKNDGFSVELKPNDSDWYRVLTFSVKGEQPLKGEYGLLRIVQEPITDNN